MGERQRNSHLWVVRVRGTPSMFLEVDPLGVRSFRTWAGAESARKSLLNPIPWETVKMVPVEPKPKQRASG